MLLINQLLYVSYLLAHATVTVTFDLVVYVLSLGEGSVVLCHYDYVICIALHMCKIYQFALCLSENVCS